MSAIVLGILVHPVDWQVFFIYPGNVVFASGVRLSRN